MWTAIAALATIRVECPPFWPIREYGDYAYFERNYGYQTSVGRQLGNTEPGDGARYCGKGLLQLTGRSNHRNYGQRIGVDLEGNPDLALDPDVGAQVFTLYFTDRDIPGSAQRQDWRAVRQKVNGGYNGWDTFAGAVDAYKRMAGV